MTLSNKSIIQIYLPQQRMGQKRIFKDILLEIKTKESITLNYVQVPNENAQYFQFMKVLIKFGLFPCIYYAS